MIGSRSVKKLNQFPFKNLCTTFAVCLTSKVLKIVSFESPSCGSDFHIEESWCHTECVSKGVTKDWKDLITQYFHLEDW